MTKMKVFGCKELSVLKDFRNSPKTQKNVIKTLNEGDVVSLNTLNKYWSWDDRAYYEVDLGYGNVGYAAADALMEVN